MQRPGDDRRVAGSHRAGRGATGTGSPPHSRHYALEQSSLDLSIESSVRTPLRTTAEAQPCHAASGNGTAGRPATIIPACDTYEIVRTWTADLVSGLPAAPDPRRSRSGAFSSTSSPLRPAWSRPRTLEAHRHHHGHEPVSPAAEPALGAGRALDAALGDPQFAAWLAKQPRDAWVNANLFLQPRAFGVPGSARGAVLGRRAVPRTTKLGESSTSMPSAARSSAGRSATSP